MSRELFLDGYRAFRRGEPLDQARPRNWRAGWKNAELAARAARQNPTPTTPDLQRSPS